MKWLLSRLAEPSTWAGLAAALPSIVSLAANTNNPAAWAAAAGGIAAALLPEQGAGHA